MSLDLIGPYKIRREVREDPLILKALTMVDPATGWFEIIKYKYKHADTIANLVDQTGLCIYLRLTIINYDFRE